MDKLRWIAWVLVFLILGCAGVQTGKKMTLFDDTARAYLRALRWGDYEAAYAFRNLSGTEDQSTILRIVDIQYYRITNVTVKNLIDRQKWEYDKEANRWYLTSDLPDFK
jgi:hypothetical protein